MRGHLNMNTWLDQRLYPFKSHFLQVPDGKMHYVDEGEGEPLLLLHGTPTWSFMYRHLIAGLSDHYRVIAPDHLGSGLSEQPDGYSYRPVDQARNLQAFIEALNLTDITLVVHDFGGPIGLSYALEHPENVRRVILFNTWLWSMSRTPDKVLMGGLLGTAFGRFLYRRMDFEFRVIVPTVYGDRAKLTPDVLAHYRGPFDADIAWVYAREILGSSAWFDQLWSRREALRDVPLLLVWGLKDVAFGAPYLKRWRTAFPHAEVHTLDHVGHFVPDEAGAEVVPRLRDFLQKDISAS